MGPSHPMYDRCSVCLHTDCTYNVRLTVRCNHVLCLVGTSARTDQSGREERPGAHTAENTQSRETHGRAQALLRKRSQSHSQKRVTRHVAGPQVCSPSDERRSTGDYGVGRASLCFVESRADFPAGNLFRLSNGTRGLCVTPHDRRPVSSSKFHVENI